MSAQRDLVLSEMPRFPCEECGALVPFNHRCPWEGFEYATGFQAIAFYTMIGILLLIFWGAVGWGVAQIF